jgi:hypothetical protein
MNVKILSKQYLELFEKRDTTGLREMLSENVRLRDWDFNEHGINNVMSIFDKIYTVVETLEVHIVDVFCEGNKSSIESEITINGKKILVVDLLEFNDDGLLEEIRAFKGN